MSKKVRSESESFFSSPDVKQASDRIQSWSQHNVRSHSAHVVPCTSSRWATTVSHPDDEFGWDGKRSSGNSRSTTGSILRGLTAPPQRGKISLKDDRPLHSNQNRGTEQHFLGCICNFRKDLSVARRVTLAVAFCFLPQNFCEVAGTYEWY